MSPPERIFCSESPARPFASAGLVSSLSWCSVSGLDHLFVIRGVEMPEGTDELRSKHSISVKIALAKKGKRRRK